MMKRNLVIFCGAGFSAQFGIPVMSGFPDKLRESGFLGEDQSDFDDIQLTCDSLGLLIGHSSRNLEQLSSLLAVMDLTKPTFRFPRCKKYRTPADALGLVKTCIHKMVKPDLKSAETGHLQAALQKVWQYYDISFVTTNYDLVIELAGHLNSSLRPVRPTKSILGGRSPINIPQLYASDEHAPAIFKLHGSINWYMDDGKLIVRDCLLQTPRGATVNFEQAPYSSKAMIVAPSVIKPEINPILREQWEGACASMSQADAIWFIGYSFPESDSFMRYFLASALTDNMRIRQLVVIDPDIAVKGRSLGIFRAPRLSEVYRFAPMKWSAVDFGDLATDNIRSAMRGFMPEQQDQINKLNSLVYASKE